MLNEQLSAWCDGELSDDEVGRLSKPVSLSDEQRADCELSWLIGDVLRGESMLSSDFTDQVMAALSAEPVVFVPAVVAVRRPRRFAAQWLPVAAAIAGVLVAGWMAMSVWSGAGAGGSAPVVAVAPPAVVKQVPPNNVALAADRAYLMAHQASSVGAPMADVVHFIRTVSDDQQDMGK